MKTFYIDIEETLVKTVEVHAETLTEAIRKTKEAYEDDLVELTRWDDLRYTEYEENHLYTDSICKKLYTIE